MRQQTCHSTRDQTFDTCLPVRRGEEDPLIRVHLRVYKVQSSKSGPLGGTAPLSPWEPICQQVTSIPV